MKKGYKVQLICRACNHKYFVHPYRKELSKFCSASCHGKYRYAQIKERFTIVRRGIDHPTFGKRLPESWRKKISQNHADMRGDKNPSWKGDKVGYHGIHDWIAKERGKPQLCELCGSNHKQKYEWANRSRKYKRDTNDWIRLCVYCHRKADYHQAPL